MRLTSIRLGDYIERSTENNRELRYGSEYIVGVNSQGVFSEPKGNTDDIDLAPYKIVNNGAFVYTPTRINLGSIAYRTQGLCLVSHLYIVFYLSTEGKKIIDPIWLYMYLRRREFGREVDFRLFGSARPEFSFSDISEIVIPLPDIEIQRKYIKIYNAMLANQQCYENGLEDLKLVCDANIDNSRKRFKVMNLGNYIELINKTNDDLLYGEEDVMGMTITKEVIPTKANVNGVNLSKYIVVAPGEFIYNPRTHGKKIGLGYNNTDNSFIISWNNIAFKIKEQKKNEILSEYLFLYFKRNEWDREACFHSWGSSTEVFTWESLCDMRIPIPDIIFQQEIVNIYKAYDMRKIINEKLKIQIKEIYSILIKGSIDEAREA